VREKQDPQKVCFVRLDRLRVVSWAKQNGRKVPAIPGFVPVKDHRLRPQGTTPIYERVKILRSVASGTEIAWQYQRRRGWVKPWRITWVAEDRTGIPPTDVLRILKRCEYFRFLLVELAFDFSPGSGINRTFVKRHGQFGKSRRRFDRGGPGQVRYGSRKSGKLVRSYWKKEVNAFRIEIELHSRLLSKGKHKKEQNYNLLEVPGRILPSGVRNHVRFVHFRWKALKRHLTSRFGPQGMEIYERARAKASVSLRSATRFLRRQRVNNVHRFLAPMLINKAIDEALTNWEIDFHNHWNRII
jgi:hypothetical protein